MDSSNLIPSKNESEISKDSIERSQFDDFYKSKLEELEKENQQLKLVKKSLQNHLNFLMKKIRHIKLAKSEDLVEEENIEVSGLRFSITESNGLSSRCYTTLFDSLDDFSINQDNDEFRISGLENTTSVESYSSDSYIDLNANDHLEHPPQILISRKKILTPEDTEYQNRSTDTFFSNHLNEPIFLPEDLKGSILSPEIVIKSPRKSTRANRQPIRTSIYNSISQPTSPDPLCRRLLKDSLTHHTITTSGTSSHSQASPLDVIRSYHSSQDREMLLQRLNTDNIFSQNSLLTNPISELIKFLPFYTCVRGIPRLAKVSTCYLQNNSYLPSGSSSSFEIGEAALNPFGLTSKFIPISPLDVEDPLQPENHYSEIPNKPQIPNNECESNVSLEYCLPPEEGSTFSNNQSGLRSPEQAQTAGQNAFRVPQNPPEKQILKRGILRKLNKKFKLWSNFWCILTNKGLFFYNIKHQPQPEDFFFIQKPVKGIAIEVMSKVEFVKSDKINFDHHLGSFEISTKHMKTYTLATGNKSYSIEWVREIKKVIRQYQAHLIMCANFNQLIHNGWVTRVKWGHSKKVWCCLAGKYLIYFNNQNDFFPTGFRSVVNSTIETRSSIVKVGENDSNSISSEFSDTQDYPDVFYTISISNNHTTPIFISLQNETEFRNWLHYLKVSVQSSTSDDVDLTKSLDLTHLVAADHRDHFYYSTGDILEPISLTTSVFLKTGAIQLWKALQRLATVEHYSIKKEHLNEKFNRISYIVQLCFQDLGLKDEVYLQLMKQSQSFIERDLRMHQTKKIKFSLFCGGDNLISSSSSIHDAYTKTMTTSTIESNEILAMWECLAILIPIFLPSPGVLQVLKKYLIIARNHNSSKEISNYSSYCFEQLQQVQNSTGRTRPPSQFEVTAISMRNPYTHSLPFSLPVYVQSGSYHVISFSPLSSIQIMHDSMLQILFTPECLQELKDVCQFAIYLHQNSGYNQFTYLNSSLKICDVISKFEEQMKQTKTGSNAKDSNAFPETNIVIKFFFRIQSIRFTKFLDWYHKNPIHCLEVSKLICYQMHNDVKSGHYSLSGSQLLNLISYLFDAYQVECAEFWHTDRTITQLVSDYFPSSLIKTSDSMNHIKSLMVTLLKGRDSELENNSANGYFQYLQYLKESCDNQFGPIITACTATSNSDCLAGQQMIVVCQESFISFLDFKCRICLKKIPIVDILSFGSTSQHFLIAYSLLPAKKCFKRIILNLLDNCSALEFANSMVFYLSAIKSQDKI